MYYWSRWTNKTTETETVVEKQNRPSWQETEHRQAIRRETRPVVVVRRRDTQPLPTVSRQTRERGRNRTTSTGITLDVKRQTYTRAPSTGPLLSGEISERTTEDF